ncbi:hypothetical protein [Microcoleus sp. Pol10D4]|uniref:hypothetical protein n=1 Tax=Microcoleus sp. Pol10D4 TaxID=3055387 RepID=UPI002FD5E8F3
MNIARLDSFDTSLNFPATVVRGLASVTGLGGLLMTVRMGVRSYLRYLVSGRAIGYNKLIN